MFRVSRLASIRVTAGHLLSFAIGGAMLACVADAPTSTAPSRIPDGALLAKGSGNPTVTLTTPNTSPQDTTIDVRVFGTGFTSGAAASWRLNGVEHPNKVRTNSTTVLSSTELIANITISDSADVASWDVQVMLVGGKKGIGTELFEITSKVIPPDNPTGTPSSGARWVFGTLGTTIDAAGNVSLLPAGIYGDGRNANGVTMGASPTLDPFVGTSSGDYQDLLCGLALRIYWWSSQISSGDGTLDPSLNTTSTCPPRTYNVNLGTTTASVYGFIYLHEVMQIPLNGSRQQATRIRINQPNCTRLAFGTPTSDSDYTTTSGGIRVTRVAGDAPTTHFLSQLPGYVPGEWVVETVDGRATCETQKGQRWIAGATMTGLYFRIHVTEIPPTP